MGGMIIVVDRRDEEDGEIGGIQNGEGRSLVTTSGVRGRRMKGGRHTTR